MKKKLTNNEITKLNPIGRSKSIVLSKIKSIEIGEESENLSDITVHHTPIMYFFCIKEFIIIFS